MHHRNSELGSSSVMPSSRVLLKKGVWSEAEDLILTRYIEKYGPGNWGQVPYKAGLNRCGKSCRLRWFNYLHPNLKSGEFEADEVDLIIRMHKLLGNRWSLIAGRIPGRTGNSIKNYYNTYLLKKKSCSERKLPLPNMRTIENNHLMMETTVIRPVPQKIFEKSHSIINKASTPSWMNINTNINTTTTRILPITSNSNDEERMKKSLIMISDDNDTSIGTPTNNNALLGFQNTTSFHVEEGLKLKNEDGSTDDYFYNFDAIQGLEDHAGHSRNWWYNDLYLGDDIGSML